MTADRRLLGLLVPLTMTAAFIFVLWRVTAHTTTTVTLFVGGANVHVLRCQPNDNSWGLTVSARVRNPYPERANIAVRFDILVYDMHSKKLVDQPYGTFDIETPNVPSGGQAVATDTFDSAVSMLDAVRYACEPTTVGANGAP